MRAFQGAITFFLEIQPDIKIIPEISIYFLAPTAGITIHPDITIPSSASKADREIQKVIITYMLDIEVDISVA